VGDDDVVERRVGAAEARESDFDDHFGREDGGVIVGDAAMVSQCVGVAGSVNSMCARASLLEILDPVSQAQRGCRVANEMRDWVNPVGPAAGVSYIRCWGAVGDVSRSMTFSFPSL